ncbi:FAD-binding-3 domain-containing protein [Fusarium falciforme]|uniref:FAD-binding-3 domain-containing protein n=1 Tax=Fusarium falciforme TaxID=195108 RepID=UPI0023008ACF|nr:FAD-binding-3 domain-containing protein [Fusarium falciforme]WAO96716.1 FAD-binding-3 domain-containing protein [Fusarium falciforme]
MSLPNHFLENKSIVVAGAGMAGLAFAISLKKRWHSSQPLRLTIFDRDIRNGDPKRQGYSLSINGVDKDGGLVALQKLGLLELVIKAATPGTTSMSFKMWDSNWSELLSVSAKPYGHLPVGGLRIARADLREILIQEAEALGIDIKWETQCLRATSKDGGIEVTVSSNAGSSTVQHECDILVAADGAHSKIRASVRPVDVLQYAGATQIGGLAVFPDGIPKPLSEAWGILISGHGNSCFASPIKDKTVVWALSKAEEMPAQPAGGDGRALLEEARNLGKEIGEPYTSLLNATDPSTAFAIPAKDKQPFNHQGVLPGVIFIGDSNHAVSPFAGNGANTAMQDGCDLAELLLSSNSLESAVAAYDNVSVPRAEKTLKSSHWRISIANLEGIKFSLFRRMVMAGGFFMWLTGK